MKISITQLPKYFLFVTVISFFIIHSSAQAPDNITGIVTDSKTRETIIGANVLIKGSTTGTLTDVNGKFDLNADRFPITLEISYLGYTKQEIVVYEPEPLEIRLILKSNKLEEIYIIGYSEKERKNLTNSVTKVASDEITNIPVASLDQQLQGKSTGLQISSATGSPGSGIFVRIRGTSSINASNDPLYVIDGIPLNENRTLQSIANSGNITSTLADINPADIESVEILKDANATAIYGSRGANGVILITTKRGKLNNKTKVTIGSYIGYSEAPRLWDIASGPEHAELQNEQWLNDGGTFETRPYRSVSEGGKGLPEEQQTYNRLKDVFRKGLIEDHSLSIAGGDANTIFYVGTDYSKFNSVLKKDGLERKSIKINIENNINRKLKIGANGYYAKTDRNIQRTGDNPKGLLQASLCVPSNQPIYKEDGTYATYGIFDNHLNILKNLVSSSSSDRVLGSAYIQYRITDDLVFKSSISIDYNVYNEWLFQNASLIEGSAANGKATEAVTTNRSWINEQILTYNKTLSPKHRIGILIGNAQHANNLHRNSATGMGFPSTEWSSIASSSTQTATEKNAENKLESFFSRIDYSYDNKYILDLNIRADGSSRFGKNNRWGYFPSAGFAWRIKEENFLQNINWVNELKLRTSYGITGNQNGIDDFGTFSLWNGGSNYLNRAGVAPLQMANPDLKWETTSQLNIGFDAGILDSRIILEFNYYNKYTTGLLLESPVPTRLGYTSVLKNEGEMSNKGIELSISTVNLQSANYKWQTSINLSHNRNRIEKLPTAFSQYNRDWVRLQEGYPMYSFWLYKQLYVDKQTGNAVYDDSNSNDGKITTDDRQITGDAWPDVYGSITNTVNYFGFDFLLAFSFSKGNKVFNMNRFFMEHGGTRYDGNYITWSYDRNQLKRWQKPGDVTDVPRLTTKSNADGSKNYNYQSSRLMEDGSFLRLSTLTLGYSFPFSFTSKLKITSLRIYVTGTNLWLLTKYLGPDPEINVAAAQSGATVQGLDFAVPPQPRTYQAGFNLIF